MDTDRQGDLWDLLNDLSEDAIPEHPSADDARWRKVWRASVILEEQNLTPSTALQQSVRDLLRNWIVALIHTPQALSPVERALCGRVLSLIGDPRPGVGLDERGLPDIYKTWCEIPAGKFIMGLNGNRRRSLPRREVEIPYSFKMAKYLVTYGQFQAFIDSGEFTNPEWWADFPEAYRPQNIREQVNPYHNHPRGYMSWYQGVAFTKWLMTKYRESGVVGEGVEIRLPTEAEWEYAARGTDERFFPYANQFDETKGNTRETGIRTTSAVGLFPDGASPFGGMDMSGNLWELCLRDYYEDDLENEYPDEERIPVRGGWFHYPLIFASTFYRYLFPISYTGHNLGLRLVCVPLLRL